MASISNSSFLLSAALLLLSCSTSKRIVSPKTSEATSNISVSIKDSTTVDSTIIIPEKAITIVPETSKKKKTTEKFNHTLFNKLLQKHVTADGRVNYKGFIANKQQLKTYLLFTSEKKPDASWTKEDKLAFWMNVYNAYTIKLIIDNYPIKSIKDIKSPWDYRFITIDDKWYTLNDIEHKILRKMKDPRIHFGINCASFSCPPLLNKAFTSATVNKQLDFLAHQFINDKSRNTISENNIEVSKIFQWFTKDFKTEGTLTDYLNKYSDITIKSNAKVRYKKYDWNLNE